LTDGSTAFNLSAYSTSPSTDGNNAAIRLRASKSNGSTSETELADNEDVLTIGNTGTELFTLKGNGSLGIGTSSPTTVHGNRTLQISGTEGGEVIIAREDAGTVNGDFVGGYIFKSTDASGSGDEATPHYAGMWSTTSQYGQMNLWLSGGRRLYEDYP
jgi:hypothetical protein